MSFFSSLFDAIHSKHIKIFYCKLNTVPLHRCENGSFGGEKSNALRRDGTIHLDGKILNLARSVFLVMMNCGKKKLVIRPEESQLNVARSVRYNTPLKAKKLGAFMLLIEFLMSITFALPLMGWSLYPLVVFVLFGFLLIYFAINSAAREIIERKLFF